MAAHRRYTDAERATALGIYERDGLAAAHRETGTPKATLRQWAKTAGMDLAAINRKATADTAAATEAVATAHRAKTAAVVAAALEQAQPKLAKVALGALDAQLAVLDGRRPKALDVGDGMRVRDLVGMGTRALHDLAVLQGRDAGNDAPPPGLVVVFATTPAAATGPAPRIIDLAPTSVVDR